VVFTCDTHRAHTMTVDVEDVGTPLHQHAYQDGIVGLDGEIERNIPGGIPGIDVGPFGNELTHSKKMLLTDRMSELPGEIRGGHEGDLPDFGRVGMLSFGSKGDHRWCGCCHRFDRFADKHRRSLNLFRVLHVIADVNSRGDITVAVDGAKRPSLCLHDTDKGAQLSDIAGGTPHKIVCQEDDLPFFDRPTAAILQIDPAGHLCPAVERFLGRVAEEPLDIPTVNEITPVGQGIVFVDLSSPFSDADGPVVAMDMGQTPDIPSAQAHVFGSADDILGFVDILDDVLDRAGIETLIMVVGMGIGMVGYQYIGHGYRTLKQLRSVDDIASDVEHGGLNLFLFDDVQEIACAS